MLQVKKRGVFGGKIRLRGRVFTGVSLLVFLASSFVFTLQVSQQVHASSQRWTAPNSGAIKLETAVNSDCALVAQHAYCWSGAVVPLASAPVPLESVAGYGVFANKNITDMSAGEATCAVADGKAYCWGDNQRGQIGDGTTDRSNVPVAVDTSGVLAGKTVTKISTGGYSQSFATCAVADGAVYCWGNNDDGQLGDGTTNSSNVPVAVDTSGVLAGKTVIDIERGGLYHTCALTSDGEVACWGAMTHGNVGQLGNGVSGPSNVPVAVDNSGVLAGKTVVSITEGWYHTCALTSDGEVACWGSIVGNENGSAYEPVLIDTSGVLAGKTITSLSAYMNVTCVAANGGAYCWGDTYNSSLGDSAHTVQSNVPVAVDLTNLLLGETVTSVSSGQYTQCLATSMAHIYCWGSNSQGQLGNNSSTDSDPAIPVQTVSLTPEFVSVTPDNISINESGSSANITAKDILPGARVWFGSQEATVTYQSSDTISVTVPASTTPGTVDVTITNPGGETVVAPNAFSYMLLTPQINSLTYTKATTLGGIRTYIQGSDFDNPTVTIGGNVATINYSGSTYIDVNVPPSSVEGFVDITVTNQNGQSTTINGGFEYIKAKQLPNQFKKTFGSAGAGNGQFDWLEGVTTDSDGNVYVTDNGNSRVQIFDKDGNYLRQFGTEGSGNGEFNYPTAIKIGPDGNIYVLDSSNYRVQVFTKNGTYLRQFGSRGFGTGQFDYAEGMAVNSRGDVYIAQCGYNSGTHEYVSSIKVFKSDGTYDRELGTQGTGDGQFDCGYALAFDKNDNVYVADARNYRIQVFDKNDNFIRKFGSEGRYGEKFDWIEDLAIDASGNILVVDSGNNRVQVFSSTGDYRGQIGKPGMGNGELDWPNSIAVGQNGNLYITDADNYRVQVFEGMTQSSAPASGPTSKPIAGVPATNSISKFIESPSTTDASNTELEQSITVNGDTPLKDDSVLPKRPTFSGVAAPFAEVVITIHSDPVVCKTTADADGKWSCTLDSDLPAGIHHVTIELTKQDGTKTTLGPYTVEVKGGDTVDSSQVADKNPSIAAKNDDSNMTPLYLSASVLVVLVLAVTLLLIRKHANKAL